MSWADGRGSSVDAGTQDFSLDELTVFGLRAGMFGEELPSGLAMYDFMVDESDPLVSLPALRLAEAASSRSPACCWSSVS